MDSVLTTHPWAAPPGLTFGQRPEFDVRLHPLSVVDVAVAQVMGHRVLHLYRHSVHCVRRQACEG